MTRIAYDASRAALYSPERRETLFEAGGVYTPMQWAVEAARLAYYRAERSPVELQRLMEALALAGFGVPRLFVSGASFAFGALHAVDGTALVAFRGTQPDDIRHVATNLQAQQTDWREGGGRVHAGFAQAARAVLPQVGDWLASEAGGRRGLVLAGHSLGAALATLAATVLAPSLVVTLGSPRVGNGDFTATLAGVEVRRVVNGCDVVVQLPPALSFYAHVGAVQYICCEDAGVVVDPSPSLMDSDRARGRAYFSEHVRRPGLVMLRELADHAPVNYARGFFG